MNRMIRVLRDRRGESMVSFPAALRVAKYTPRKSTSLFISCDKHT